MRTFESMSEHSDRAPEISYAQLILADIASAGLAGIAVSPIISAVDKALAENASGTAKLWDSFGKSIKDMVRQPMRYFRSPQFYWIWLVYGGTYAGVNVVETACTVTKTDPAVPKWFASFSVNTTTCILKDKAFAQMYSGGSVVKSVPLGSYGAWLGRDVLSMACIFTLPPIVGKSISSYTGSERSGYYAAQMGLPLVLQTVTTPIHLLGYDIYNNPNNNVAQRLKFMAKDYGKNVSIRMLRMAPPWSLGTIGNREMRSLFSGRSSGY